MSKLLILLGLLALSSATANPIAAKRRLLQDGAPPGTEAPLNIVTATPPQAEQPAAQGATAGASGGATTTLTVAPPTTEAPSDRYKRAFDTGSTTAIDLRRATFSG